jgi:hypothetical protein
MDKQDDAWHSLIARIYPNNLAAKSRAEGDILTVVRGLGCPDSYVDQVRGIITDAISISLYQNRGFTCEFRVYIQAYIPALNPLPASASWGIFTVQTTLEAQTLITEVFLYQEWVA